MRTHTLACGTQFNNKVWYLGWYKLPKDAASARDTVAKVLGFPLNFKKPPKITGHSSKDSETRVADVVKAANAFVLGRSMTWHAQ